MSRMLPKISMFYHTHVIRQEWKLKMLRISIGLVYLWFGALKFFDNLSPAEELASEILFTLSFDLVPEQVCYILLASLETLTGLLLICNIFISRIILLALLHMLGTFTPILLQPQLIFHENPMGITLLGQYILKNIIIVSALFVIYPVETIAFKEKVNIKN